MSSARGSFVWYELMTTDPIEAASFYGAVLGWSAKDSGLSDRTYMVLNVGERGIGGLMALPPQVLEAGGKPGWIGYIGVADVDAAAKGLSEAGGAIHRPPEDIPHVGRFAVVADPQGAAFVLFQPSNPESAPTPVATGTPGHVGWHELHAADWQAAVGFYAAHFGWTKDDAIDMGPMGTYQLFAIDGRQCGGMMTKTDAFPSPVWIYYFNVADIEAAAGRVKTAGGQVLNGPHQVPGGSWIAQCLDPQGALFAIVGPKR